VEQEARQQGQHKSQLADSDRLTGLDLVVLPPGTHPIVPAAFVKCTPCGVWTPEYSIAQVLIFSRAVRMLKLVQAMVTKHGWASEYLDGGTPEVRGF
jgi:hypothetical protein